MHLLPSLWCKEVLGPHILPEQHVIVEVYEVFGEALDTVDVALDRGRAVRREVALVGEYLFVGYYGNPRVVQVEPIRNLSISDDENVSDPGGVFLQRSYGVPQLLVMRQQHKELSTQVCSPV